MRVFSMLTSTMIEIRGMIRGLVEKRREIRVWSHFQSRSSVSYVPPEMTSLGFRVVRSYRNSRGAVAGAVLHSSSRFAPVQPCHVSGADQLIAHQHQSAAALAHSHFRLPCAAMSSTPILDALRQRCANKSGHVQESAAALNPALWALPLDVDELSACLNAACVAANSQQQRMSFAAQLGDVIAHHPDEVIDAFSVGCATMLGRMSTGHDWTGRDLAQLFLKLHSPVSYYPVCECSDDCDEDAYDALSDCSDCNEFHDDEMCSLGVEVSRPHPQQRARPL